MLVTFIFVIISTNTVNRNFFFSFMEDLLRKILRKILTWYPWKRGPWVYWEPWEDLLHTPTCFSPSHII